MSADKFFPQRPNSKPTIYAYEDTNPQYRGLLKIGYTTVDAKSRVAQQYPTLRPGKPPYRIVIEESAMRNDGTTFIDHDVHRHLRAVGVKNP
ncbi:MAG: GIY-YIG nuclease family protein, partial [Deltaproteobacteria bacterium]